VTEHEYDETGRLVRSVTTREPEWTEQDIGEMHALTVFRATLLCPCGCGFLLADTTSHEETGPRFQVSRTLCRARKELIEQQTAHARSFDQNAPDPIPTARLWSIAIRKG
jgi:hypothetical protein